VAEDRLIRDAGAPAERVMAEVMALELDGLVERHPGGLLGLSG
jgi:DNA processing protein